MNREEIAAKIADMEKLIQNKSAVSSQDDSIENDSETEFALCLGGGGGKGAYQLGVYEALSEYGIWDRVTAIAGASIGSKAEKPGMRSNLRLCLMSIRILCLTESLGS